MRRFLTLLVLTATCLAQGPSLPFGFVPSVSSVTGGSTYIQQAYNPSCSGNSCTVTLTQPTTPNTALICNGFSSGNNKITSCTDGGDSFSLCPSSDCFNYNSAQSSGQDMAYVAGGAGGKTSVVINMTNITFALVYEVEGPTCGGSLCTPIFDGAAAVDNSGSTCTTCTLAAPTITATDVVVHNFNSDNNGASLNGTDCSSPYILGFGGAFCIGLNITSSTAPTFTQSPAGHIQDSAIAFKFSSGTFTPSPSPIFSLVSAPLNFSPTCTPTCTITVPSTGTGHLLFLSVNPSGLGANYISSVSGGGSWVVPSGCQQYSASSGYSISCAYVLSSTSGTTSIAYTMSTGGRSGEWDYFEVARSSGSFVLDTVAANTNSSSSTTPSGTALTLSGTNDICVQGINSNSAIEVYQSLYFMPAYGSGGLNNAPFTGSLGFLLNTVNGSAPVWSLSVSEPSIVFGVCFK